MEMAYIPKMHGTIHFVNYRDYLKLLNKMHTNNRMERYMYLTQNVTTFLNLYANSGDLYSALSPIIKTRRH